MLFDVIYNRHIFEFISFYHMLDDDVWQINIAQVSDFWVVGGTNTVL